jgi:CBS domain-containing protein
MLVENLIRRSAVTVPPRVVVTEAARLMKENDVGSVVILEDNRVVGVLTDRDIVVGPVAEGRDPSTVAVESVMTPDPVCLPTGIDVEDCLNTMQVHAVRRMPLVNEAGRLVGVVSLDDVLLHLGDQVGSAANLIRKEVVFLPARAETR